MRLAVEKECVQRLVLAKLLFLSNAWLHLQDCIALLSVPH